MYDGEGQWVEQYTSSGSSNYTNYLPSAVEGVTPDHMKCPASRKLGGSRNCRRLLWATCLRSGYDTQKMFRRRPISALSPIRPMR